MIPKVNRLSILSLVPKPKKMENDPGSSQGSGNFYESAENPKKKNNPESEEKAPELMVVANPEIMGMTEVVKDFHEQKKSEAQVNPGLSVRYTADSQPAKGLLLNKKAE